MQSQPPTPQQFERRGTPYERFKQARLARKLSQMELADLLEIHQTLVSMIERGDRTPGLFTAIKIRDRLGIAIEDWTKRS